MKAIMVMFDSLNKKMLKPYGCDWIKTPNFDRLSRHTVTFENCYAGSLPCMPARRELHTGRYNFMHRSWGPIEPFDDSMPEILKESDIYTHLVTDHNHYWEDGGCTYHSRYSTWDGVRGQEGDPWKAEIDVPSLGDFSGQKALLFKKDYVNRKYIIQEDDFPQAKTFKKGIEFIETNHLSDNWFLQIETFDPHEPFYVPEKYQEVYESDYDGPTIDWPDYQKVIENDVEIKHIRMQYAALVTMCDTYLGKVLDIMDKYNMWEDTMLIVNTDHGFLLSEHDWWGKCAMPTYNEIANIPLFIWDPRTKKKNERRNSIVQTIDLPATLLEFFGLDLPKYMMGKSLKDVIMRDEPIREAALFGIFGTTINCTDGRYIYMKGINNKDNTPLYQYTLMPTHMRKLFSVEETKTSKLHKGFSFTKGSPLLKIEAGVWDDRDAYSMSGYQTPDKRFSTMLFDLEQDPLQENPLHDENIEQKMNQLVIKLMKENEAPEEQFTRLGLKN